MTRQRRVFLGIGLMLVATVALLLGYFMIWVPLKFNYLTYRVESARSAEEERKAFKLAADWGRIWEVNRLSPSDAAAESQKMTGDWLLRLEWLQISPFNGAAYVAYRAVIDTNNLQLLYRSY